MLKSFLPLLGILFGTALSAQDKAAQQDAFVESNILGIFYHELGHALIDIEGLPIYGQEEDAADVASIFLIDAFFQEADALALAEHAALGFSAEAKERKSSGGEVAWWDVHGPDEQRFYNTVCLFYGADPGERRGYARKLGLPEERADYCPEEFDQANHSWGALLDEIAERGGGRSITFRGEKGDTASFTEEILADEVDFLNENFTLSHDLQIVVEECGQANAFYDPQEATITMCFEFEDYLFELAEDL